MRSVIASPKLPPTRPSDAGGADRCWDGLRVSSHIRGVRDVWLRVPRSFSLHHHVGRLESGIYLLPSNSNPAARASMGVENTLLE